MLTHIALFRLKPEAEGQDKAANLAQILQNVRDMAGGIPSALSVVAGPHHEVADFPFPAHDIAVVARFNTEADYVAYVTHPLHRKAAAFAAAVAESTSAITFESEG